MYKSKLQELCQRWRWPLPEYDTVKEGPQHLPCFKATVNVNGHTFFTPTHFNSAKEAQNNVAHIAVYHLTNLSAQVANYPAVNYQTQAVNYAAHQPNYQTPQAVSYSGGYQMPSMQLMPQYPVAETGPVMPISPSPSDLPIPSFPTSALATRNDPHANGLHDRLALQQSFENAMPSTAGPAGSLQSKKGKSHVYKNLLQRYAHKKAITLPVYDTTTEGPGHALRFKSKVSVDGQSYETQDLFTTLKEAEQAAAKVACDALSLNMVEGDDVSYKNLLQELAMRKGLDHPSYKTASFGLSHKPAFLSKVELGALAFEGVEAKTKKQAETSAAKVAYHALLDASQPANHQAPSSAVPAVSVRDEKTEPENSARTSSVDQSATATVKIEERQSIRKQATRKQANVLDGEVQSKKAKTETENVNVDVPDTSAATLPPSDPSPVHGSSVVALPPFDTHAARTVIVPHKTTLELPENSSSSVMPISDKQWVVYKVEMKQDPGTTA